MTIMNNWTRSYQRSMKRYAYSVKFRGFFRFFLLILYHPINSAASYMMLRIAEKDTQLSLPRLDDPRRVDICPIPKGTTVVFDTVGYSELAFAITHSIQSRTIAYFI